MSLVQQFKAYITAGNLFSPKDTLLLAVSGGLDSVVLCELCKQVGFNFLIAHCNFRLRGQESERDAGFVKQLASQYNVQFLYKEFETKAYAAQNKLSVQEAARVLRYSWFEEEIRILRSNPCTTAHLLTAHHLDDNIETMLLHFFRGTGIQGLKGMLPKQDNVIRPLLFAKKQELQQFAIEHKLDWVEDSSNLTDDYSRNFVRHQVLPLMQQVYPDVENNLARNLQRFAETAALYRQAVDGYKKKLLEIKGNEIHIPVMKLQRVTPLYSIVYEIIKDFGFTAAQTEDVIALCYSESGRFIPSASHRIIKNRNWLIIAPLQTGKSATILIEEGNTRVPFSLGSLQLERLPAAGFRSVTKMEKTQACVDARLISYPLLLRRWKPGDYFYPLGLKKKKKLARFLIDQKLSRTEKEKVWVLEMNKKIVWVVGMRIDDRFKISAATQELLIITLT